MKGRHDTEKKRKENEVLTFRSCWILHYDYIVRKRNWKKGSRAQEVMSVEEGSKRVTCRSKGQKMEGGCKRRGHFGSCRSLQETTELVFYTL